MGIHQVYQYETSSATKLITEDSDYVGDRIWHRIAPENLLRLSQLISSTINNWVLENTKPWYKQIILKFKYIDSEDIVLRHFRWCCGLKQPYLHLLQFTTVDDVIIKCFDKGKPKETEMNRIENHQWNSIANRVFEDLTKFLL